MAMTLQQAITQLEGVNPVYNNPGAISGTGDTGTSFGQGIGVYSSLAAGKAALNKQVQSMLSGNSSLYPSSMTLQDAGTLYSGGNTDYGNNLAKLMGVSPTTTLGQLNSGAGNILQKAIGVIDGIGMGVGLPAPVSTTVSTAFSLPSVQNITFIILGIIFIGVGLSMFHTTRTIIQTGTAVAKKGIELAA